MVDHYIQIVAYGCTRIHKLNHTTDPWSCTHSQLDARFQRFTFGMSHLEKFDESKKYFGFLGPDCVLSRKKKRSIPAQSKNQIIRLSQVPITEM